MQGLAQAVLPISVFQHVQQFFRFAGGISVAGVRVVGDVGNVFTQAVGLGIEASDLILDLRYAGLELFLLILRCRDAGGQGSAHRILRLIAGFCGQQQGFSGGDNAGSEGILKLGECGQNAQGCGLVYRHGTPAGLLCGADLDQSVIGYFNESFDSCVREGQLVGLRRRFYCDIVLI